MYLVNVNKKFSTLEFFQIMTIPYAQESPKQNTSQKSTGMSIYSNNSLQQNVVQGQSPAMNQQASKKPTVAHQQQSSLLWPPAPGSHVASGHQG